MTIKRNLGERMMFSGGAEETPLVSVGSFSMPGSLHDGDKNLMISQGKGKTVRLSVETMKAIIAWAEKEGG